MKGLSNFLNEIREVSTSNTASLVRIDEVNAKSMIERHSKDGYVVVSACRSYSDYNLDPDTDQEKLNRLNRITTQGLIRLIKKSGYSYTPVYGGFIENKGTENETTVFERSFIIYNHDKDGNVLDFENLRRLALKITQEYNQDSYLEQSPDGVLRYVTKDDETDFEFSGKAAFNDVSKEYFTDLHKYHTKNPSGKLTRITFECAYVNPGAQGLSEAHVRHLSGEVALPYLH